MSWAASALDRDNDHRLLVEQTRQAAAVISSGIVGIANPLATALKIEAATGDTETQFDQFMVAYVGAGRLFTSASLWEVSASSLSSVANLGGPPALNPTSSRARSLARAATHTTSFVVTQIRSGVLRSIGYAVAEGSSPTFVLYAERAIPANRRVAVEANSAFSDLDYATYLGATTDTADLATTDLSPSELPLTGNVARVSIPFGNSSITLVATPRGQLGGAIGAQLPWVFLIGGMLLTALIAAVADQLVRRRRVAERDAVTIAELYDRLNGLYAEQRSIAETLQRALLPQQHPVIPNVEIASRYVAGAVGVDVGGDWYSVIALDENRFAFVVGDVSGRGIGAATIMARLRFTIRAYLFEGHSPDRVLEMCSRQLDISSDGYLATVLVGVGDRTTGEIRLASAGHPPPLVIGMSDSSYVTIDVGPPLGVGQSEYVVTTAAMPSGSTFLAFTDGLVERRRESLDTGFERLLSATALRPTDLDAWLDGVVSAMGHDGAEDDIAVLALRWTSAHDRSELLSKPG
ncbi:MAG TPA: PP2C family protein-serine/threonine phosphatase [Acidimicrobiales bacterium]|nr:PP2C family protein-serine/threonine phosphatase [Acidimicrobiales bacterium]